MSLINREALLSFEKMDADLCATCGEHHTAEDVIMMIKTAPTVDAVPVVRCKDCVNGTVFVDKQGAEYVDCVLDDYSVRKPTDYCSYGKRKEGADNDT